jgi:release factor glutamine methyltransferase
VRSALGGSGPGGSVPTEAAITARLRAAGCVFAEDEARLLMAADVSATERAAMIERRVAGFPLEHILGWVEFCGLRMAVGPGVFVPRRRTEYLVHEAARLAHPGAVVLDLCCGCGALGAALAASVSGVELYAADIETAAVRYARRNLAAAAGRTYVGDLFEPLPQELRGRIEVLLCNTPYVPTDEIGRMPPEARLHEPHVTLDGGPDGLDVQRRVAASAGQWLAPGGHLLVEASDSQAPQAVELFRRAGFESRISHSGRWHATIVVATNPANRNVQPTPIQGA